MHLTRNLGLVMIVALGVLGCSPAPDSPPAGAAALQAYLDPATGTFKEPPPEVAARWAAEAADKGARAASLGVREFAGTSPAGGVGVELDESFTSALAATLTTAGEIAITCGEPGSEGAR